MAGERAILDTNVVLAAHRSEHPTSPNRELLDRWKAGEFTLLHSDDILLEYAEKMLEYGAAEAEVIAFMARLQVLGEAVRIEFFHLPRYPPDADDIAFVLCAINGDASHLVTYDDDLLSFTGDFHFLICKPLIFLGTLRSPPRRK